MKIATSLPVINLTPSHCLQVHTPPETAFRPLPRVERKVRNGSVLHASPMGHNGEVLSLNLAMGCAHRCGFCSARAYPTYPGDEVVYLYTNTPERLAAELASRRQRPRAVYVSPSTDPFPPLAKVQDMTLRV